MDKAALWIIGFYQRFLSPWKGFRCAAAAFYGSDNCSIAVKKIIEENGLIGGRPRISEQFRLCATASSALAEDEEKKRKRRRRDRDTAGCLTEAACTSCAFWHF